MKTVEVLTRKGCHLCDLLLGELDLLRESVPFRVRLTYLEDEPRLTELYGNDVPVVLVEGVEVCRHRLDREVLARRLAVDESKSQT